MITTYLLPPVTVNMPWYVVSQISLRCWFLPVFAPEQQTNTADIIPASMALEEPGYAHAALRYDWFQALGRLEKPSTQWAIPGSNLVMLTIWLTFSERPSYRARGRTGRCRAAPCTYTGNTLLSVS
jgi:hypothetical protein